MALYVNNTGKFLIGAVAASAVTQAVTGRDTGLARGCAIGLVVWLAWVSFVLFTIAWLIFG